MSEILHSGTWEVKGNNLGLCIISGNAFDSIYPVSHFAEGNLVQIAIFADIVFNARNAENMVEQIIVSSGDHLRNGLAIESIKPLLGKSFTQQVESCIEQLYDIVFPKGEARYYITQQTFFIAANSRGDYEERSSFIMKKVSECCGEMLPATSVVAQRPARGSEVVLELICTRTAKGKEIIYKSAGGISYTLVNHGSFKVVHASGLGGGPEDSIQKSAEKAFESAVKILSLEGLSIKNIIRQWNYVEDIATLVDRARNTQNYQVFNDVRAKFYGTETFPNGYPAATGIGMNTGGVIIGFIAVSDSDQLGIKPIRNPRQIDAHKYSDGVLVGRASGIMGEKCTPKFERGKMVVMDGDAHMYVSGTASIVGEKTLHPRDVEKQTITTIENIFELFSDENQTKLGVHFDVNQIEFSHLRIYVKHQEDFPKVQAICKSMLNSRSFLFLQSDICREELLVEIEGIFTIK